MSKKRQSSYSDWSLDTVRKAFALQITRQKLFENIKPVLPAHWLQEILQRSTHLALTSEKARSEFIVAPILLFVSDSLMPQCSVYSGVRFDVNQEQGLYGICDFILSRSPALPTVQAPVLMLVEAKKNDVDEGMGQCVAEMIAAQLFNQQEQASIETIYGCVTTGETWQFMRLNSTQLAIDDNKYFINELELLLGCFQYLLSDI